MTRTDPELGTVRRCRRCQEEWPLDAEFFGPLNGRYLRGTCRACRAELARGITPPKRVVTDEQMASTSRTSRRWNAAHASLMLDRTRAWKARLRASLVALRSVAA